MPIYAKVADLERLVSPAVVVQLSDDKKNGQKDESVVDDAIERAEGLVHAALVSGGYKVPITLPIPQGAEVIKGATCWLAVCDLAARKGEIPEEYKNQCLLYSAMLDKIANGTIGLPLPAGDINMPHSSTLGQEKVFTHSKFETGSGDLRNEDEARSLDDVNGAP